MRNYAISKLRDVVRQRTMTCSTERCIDVLDHIVCKGPPVRTATEKDGDFDQQEIEGLVLVDEFVLLPPTAGHQAA